MVRLIIAVDDTDDVSKKTSTGKIAEKMAKEVEKLGGIIELGITRHQLFLHPQIAYTSHNSAMCFGADVLEGDVEEIWKTLSRVLLGEMSDSSDPGLCMCRMDEAINVEKLIHFGKRAQKEVIQKAEAYNMAKETNIRLEEFGGTGLGVIGSLAGVGLRLSGNDGVFRGKKKSKPVEGIVTVKECMSKLEVSHVMTKDGNHLLEEDIVMVGEQIKLLFYDYQKVAMVKKQDDGIWKICDRYQLEKNEWKQKGWDKNCECFQLDNDIEECVDSQKACYNCLFRKWNSNGFKCIKI